MHLESMDVWEEIMLRQTHGTRKEMEAGRRVLQGSRGKRGAGKVLQATRREGERKRENRKEKKRRRVTTKTGSREKNRLKPTSR